MEVIAAINLYNSQCIDSLESEYKVIQDCKPIDIAIKWNNIGANWIHIVDVNGYKEHNPLNIDIIKAIISAVKVPIQVAAGIDNLDMFEEVLAAGAGRILIDNLVLHKSDFIEKVLSLYPEKTVIILDVDSGMTKIKDNYHENIIDITKSLTEKGLQRVVYHDSSQNLTFNFDDFANLAKNVKIPVIAAGKLNDMESIKRIKQVADCENISLEGIILSKALYNNSLDLYEVIKLVKAYPYIGDFYSREDIC